MAIGETFAIREKQQLFRVRMAVERYMDIRIVMTIRVVFKTKNPSVIKNLTIAGSILIISNAASAITAGGVAAAVTGTTTIQWVTVEEKNYSGYSENNVLSVGGFWRWKWKRGSIGFR